MMRFFYGSGSPYSWRVQLVLEEKALPYEPVLLSFSDGDHKKPEHMRRHPHGKVPALSDGDLVLYESSVIVEYLEERYPAPPLMPVSPADRAAVRIEEAECLEYMGRSFLELARKVFFTPAAQRDPEQIAAGRAAVRSELERLESRAATRGGAFVLGHTLTRADCAWIPFVEIAGRAGVALEGAATPWLVAWRDAWRARPTYQRSLPPHWRAT